MTFWEIVEENNRIVATWPQWMQDIEISAEATSTGRFIRVRENKERVE